MLFYGNAEDELEYMDRRMREYLQQLRLKKEMEKFEKDRCLNDEKHDQHIENDNA